ncbi:MAG TPA: DUF4870 domain-containing protein [Pyrinomonadaceae bacterium]|jgi:uncharacterized membrane protein|nr:DUF4870 domain-containing protein [Pyrinomonadaceae bacterium]
MQNPPPGQQNFGSAPGTPPPAPGSSQTGGTGLDPKVAAAISYIWIVGLIFYFIEKENKFVRFHAMQSILFGIANSVIMMVLAIIATVLTVVFTLGAAAAATATGSGGIGSLISLLVGLIWLIFWLLALLFLVGLILAAVKAYQGQKFKLPIIGNMAEKIVNK